MEEKKHLIMHFMGKEKKFIQVYYTPIFFSLSILQVIPHTEQFTHKGNSSLK